MGECREYRMTNSLDSRRSDYKYVAALDVNGINVYQNSVGDVCECSRPPSRTVSHATLLSSTERPSVSGGTDGGKRRPELTPLDGCVLLAKDEARAICEYATRFHITEREAQQRSAQRGVIYSEILPCCAPGAEGGGVKDRIWGALHSELFLCLLQLLVLSLSVSRILIHRPQPNVHDNTHLLIAVLETVITCTLIIIRAFAGKDKLNEILEKRLNLEYIRSPDLDKSRTETVWANVYSFVSVMIILTVIGAFIVCFMMAAIGWVALTNNAVIVIMTFLQKMTTLRCEFAIAQIQQDHQFILMVEAEMLLDELMSVTNPSTAPGVAEQQREAVRARVKHFLRGMSRTFQHPVYIACREEHRTEYIQDRETGL